MDDGDSGYDTTQDNLGGKATQPQPGSSEVERAWNEKNKKTYEKVQETRTSIEEQTDRALSRETLLETINYFLSIRKDFVNYKNHIKATEHKIIKTSEINQNSVDKIIQMTSDLALLLEEYSKETIPYSRVRLLIMIDDLLPQIKNLLPVDNSSAGR
jgi:hypothetical protein